MLTAARTFAHTTSAGRPDPQRRPFREDGRGAAPASAYGWLRAPQEGLVDEAALHHLSWLSLLPMVAYRCRSTEARKTDSTDVVRAFLITCLGLWAFWLDIVEDIKGGRSSVPLCMSVVGSSISPGQRYLRIGFCSRCMARNPQGSRKLCHGHFSSKYRRSALARSFRVGIAMSCASGSGRGGAECKCTLLHTVG